MRQRIFFIELPNDKLVFLVGEDGEPKLIVADDEDGRNEIYPAQRIAETLAAALETRVERRKAPSHLTQPEDWNYDDIGAWLQDTILKERLQKVGSPRRGARIVARR